MEGYVAAAYSRTAYPYNVVKTPRPSQPSPQRAKTTKATSTTKRHRFTFGHRRTSSSDSASRSSHEVASPPVPTPAAPHPPLDQSPPAAPSPEDRPSQAQQPQAQKPQAQQNQEQQPQEQQPQEQQQREQHPREQHQRKRPQQYVLPRRPSSALYRNKELPPPPSPPLSPPVSPDLNAAFYASVAIPSSLPTPASPSSRSASGTTVERRKKKKIKKQRQQQQEGEPKSETDDQHHQQQQEKLQQTLLELRRLHQDAEQEQDQEHGDEQEQELQRLLQQQKLLEQKIKQQKQLLFQQQQQQQQQQISYASIVPVPTPLFTKNVNTFTRNDSVSSTSGLTALSTKTMLSLTSDAPSSADGVGSSSQSLLSTSSGHSKPLVVRNGRTYLSDPSLPYPLPVDLAELHRQSLRSLLLFQLFGGPVCSPAFANNPPTRVLEVGCGSAFWSIMCSQYYARQGHRGISFSGIDIAPVGSGANTAGGRGRSSLTSLSGPDKERDGMNWRFVQHDMRRLPWPFAAEEFDLIMIKDVSLAMRTDTYQLVIDECIRLLQPGGTLEVWDSDHAIRLLRPHVPAAPQGVSEDEEDDYDSAVSAGAYVLTSNTPLSAPLNTYIVEYNAWLVKALEQRSLPFAPCALTGALFLQEAEALTSASSRRLAVPLSEMRWEREGVGGVVTKDGKTYIETKGKPSKAKDQGQTGRDEEQGQGQQQQQGGKKTITPAQGALRRTALLTVVQMIQSLEPLLREVSGKSQDEWDGWSGKMMNDLMKENGTYWGECLEVGAWWAQKKAR